MPITHAPKTSQNGIHFYFSWAYIVNLFILEQVRQKSRDFFAFSSMVPSRAMSLQLFGVLSPSEDEEDAQLMVVEVEPCGGCNLFYFNFSFSPAFF